MNTYSSIIDSANDPLLALSIEDFMADLFPTIRIEVREQSVIILPNIFINSGPTMAQFPMSDRGTESGTCYLHHDLDTNDAKEKCTILSTQNAISSQGTLFALNSLLEEILKDNFPEFDLSKLRNDNYMKCFFYGTPTVDQRKLHEAEKFISDFIKKIKMDNKERFTINNWEGTPKTTIIYEPNGLHSVDGSKVDKESLGTLNLFRV